jgi:hypothetical protein
MSAIVMEVIGRFMSSRIGQIITLCAVGILVVLCVVMTVSLKTTKAALDKTISDKAVLSAQVQLQNQGIEQWKKEAATQKARAAEAQKTAGRVRTVTETRVERILATPVEASAAVQWGYSTARLQGGWP